jgi:excisionase family DNA binding protein
MEKLFYTLEEAAQRLGKSQDAVREMAQKGQLSEFRDRDRLMFKKEQVDLLAGGEEEGLRLADSGELEPLTLASSGSVPGLADSRAKENTGTGLNLLEIESTDEADANAVTRVTNSPQPLVDPGDEKGKSGSAGLLDLTREADDTSLGAGLLEDVYGSETVASQTVAPDAGGVSGAEGGSLFESPSAGADAMDAAAPIGAIAVEPYDGPGSGLVGGLSIGAALTLLVAAFAVIAGMTGSGGGLLETISSNWMAIIGGCAGLTAVCAVLGWVLGKKR